MVVTNLKSCSFKDFFDKYADVIFVDKFSSM